MLSRSPHNGFGRGVPVVPTGLPAWRTGQPVNSWVEIAGSAMSNFPPSVNPGGITGPSSKMDTWCGLAIDTRTNTIWSLANGGHDDYWGNEVDKLDLGVDNPEWIEVLASSPSSQVQPAGSSTGHYLDGRPGSCHSYNCQQFIEARNRAMRFSSTAYSRSGNGTTDVEGFDCTVATGVNGWDATGTWAPVPNSGNGGSQSVKNPKTEDVFYFYGNTAVYKWTQTTNAWSKVSADYPPVSVGECGADYDTLRDRIFVFKSPDICHTFDPTTGIFTPCTLTGAGAAALNASTKAMGLVYEPTLDVYLVRLGASGPAVYSVNASTFEVTTLATTGGSSLPATVVISGSPENVYSRFLYAPLLGGVVYFPQYAANAWFLRTN